MLYEPVINPKGDKLEVIKTSTSSFGYHNPMNTKKYHSYTQNFDHIDLPLFTLISIFGDLIPGPRNILPHDPAFMKGPVEILKVPDICFYTLQHVAGLKIEWVTSLELHLELDTGKKTLKLFQSPSFCRMLRSAGKRHILSR